MPDTESTCTCFSKVAENLRFRTSSKEKKKKANKKGGQPQLDRLSAHAENYEAGRRPRGGTHDLGKCGSWLKAWEGKK